MHNKKNNFNKTCNFIQGLRPIENTLPKEAKKMLKKSGYNMNNILKNWEKIVGGAIYKLGTPISLKFGKDFKNNTIVVNVFHGKELELEYKKKEIIDKVNSFFGHRFLDRVKTKILENNQKSFISQKEKNFKKINTKDFANVKNDAVKKSLERLIKVYNEKN